ncbi:MAG: imidazoleglycerol-phosphate dehydratase HisB [bacterium]
MKPRQSSIPPRKTTETEISLEICLDGSGQAQVQTGIGMMDHMLTLFAKHGLFDLKVSCRGDLQVDMHHSIEDLGICLGSAVLNALGDKRGINRFGFFYITMDESLARAVVDLSGRPYLVFNAHLPPAQDSSFDYSMAQHFFKSFSDNCKANINIELLSGNNNHHCLEAIFKAFSRALAQSCGIQHGNADDLPTTKGLL